MPHFNINEWHSNKSTRIVCIPFYFHNKFFMFNYFRFGSVLISNELDNMITKKTITWSIMVR